MKPCDVETLLSLAKIHMPAYCRDDLVGDAYIHFSTKVDLEGKEAPKVILNYLENRFKALYRQSKNLVQLNFDAEDLAGKPFSYLDSSDLREGLESLPPVLAATLSARLSGDTFAEIGRSFGTSRKTAYMRYKKSCELMKKWYMLHRRSDDEAAD
jgi:hypothetical protein